MPLARCIRCQHEADRSPFDTSACPSCGGAMVVPDSPQDTSIAFDYRESRSAQRVLNVSVAMTVGDVVKDARLGALWQEAPDGQSFEGANPPRLHLLYEGPVPLTRERWEVVRGAIDRAWEAFEARWPPEREPSFVDGST